MIPLLNGVLKRLSMKPEKLPILKRKSSNNSIKTSKPERPQWQVQSKNGNKPRLPLKQTWKPFGKLKLFLIILMRMILQNKQLKPKRLKLKEKHKIRETPLQRNSELSRRT